MNRHILTLPVSQRLKRHMCTVFARLVISVHVSLGRTCLALECTQLHLLCCRHAHGQRQSFALWRRRAASGELGKSHLRSHQPQHHCREAKNACHCCKVVLGDLATSQAWVFFYNFSLELIGNCKSEIARTNFFCSWCDCILVFSLNPCGST